MANDTQKRSLLDQLTTNAATPAADVPAPLTPALADPNATAGGTIAPPLPTGTSATTTGSTANLESAADSPGTTGEKIAADNKTADTAKNGGSFLSKLGRIAGGMSGLTDPNSSSQAALGSRISSLAGRVGNGLAVAAGTPEQKQIGEENSQIPLKMAQIDNERKYREAVVANNVAKTQGQYAVGDPNDPSNPEGTSRQNQDSHAITAAAAAQNAASNEDLRNAHARQIEAQMNGKVFVTSEAAHAAGDDSMANQELSAMAYLQRVTNPINNQLKAAGGAKTVDLGADGVWGYNAFTGKTTRQGDSPSVARSNAMMLRTQLPMKDPRGNFTGTWNPQTDTFTALDGAVSRGVPPGAVGYATSDNGNGQQQQVMATQPTGNTLSRGQVAQTILPQFVGLKQNISDLADKIGPGTGRWNQFWVNKGGIDDPAYANLDQKLKFIATAVGMAHFGASTPEGFVDEMMKDFGLAQSPANLQGRVDAAEDLLKAYANRVGGGPAPNSPAKPASGGGGFAAWDKANPKPTGGK